MIGFLLYEIESARLQLQIEREMVDRARQDMAPEAFEKWQAERVAERRHRELCNAVREAGAAARPRGFGLFW